MQNFKKLEAKDQFTLDSTNLSYKRPEYNGLTDPNLVSYFSSPRRRRLLIQQQLVFYKQINQIGEINEKACEKKIASVIFKTQSIRKPTGSPIFKGRHAKKQTLTPEQRPFQMKKYEERHGKLPLIQPMSSVEFREMISKRRILMSENSYL